MNAEVAAWMRHDAAPGGYAPPPYLAMGDGRSVMWNRQLSVERWTNPVDRLRAAGEVEAALRAVGARRLVVGHTPQVRPGGGWGGEGGWTSRPQARPAPGGLLCCAGSASATASTPLAAPPTPTTPLGPPCPQMRGVNAECGGLVWRVDVGMSSGVLGSPAAVLEIDRDAAGEVRCQVISEGDGLATYDDLALLDF